MKKLIVLVLLFFLLIFMIPKKEKSPNIFLITLDGVRWQEVFYGIDKDLVEKTNYVEDKELLINKSSKFSLKRCEQKSSKSF